jgi:hypothetical protein
MDFSSLREGLVASCGWDGRTSVWGQDAVRV